MKRLRPIAMALAPLTVSQPVHAEWGSTHWEMTVDDVVEAVEETVEKVADDSGQRVHDQQRLATSTLRQDAVEYEVSYYFGERGRGLTMVRLKPATMADCAAMRAAYTERLGAGIDQSNRGLGDGFIVELIHWATGPGEEVVEMTDVRVNGRQMACHVMYQQRDFVKN